MPQHLLGTGFFREISYCHLAEGDTWYIYKSSQEKSEIFMGSD